MAIATPPRELTERSALDLARAIRCGETTSREVVEAHVEILRRVQPRINALACPRFDCALDEADAADARVADASDPDALPPLLGVPCTIKESIAVRGLPNCAGLVSRREHLADTTGPAAQRLLDTGVIHLGATNVSELTMWIESDNRVYGRTRNAYDPSRIAGGSSGGEGAAVGSGGAPIGLGSDIGGSIRLPAFFNGVFGHKPSPGVVPNAGQFPDVVGEIGRMLSIGPLARRAEDLMPVLRLIAGADESDSFARDVELGDPTDVDLAGMRVIVSEEASLVPPRKAMREARDRAAEALERAGADVQRVALRSMRRALELYLTTLANGAPLKLAELVVEQGSAPVTFWSALRRNGPHTIPTLLTIATEGLPGRMPHRRTERILAAGRSLAEEVEGVIGDGVMLHPPFSRPAPRHNATVGRPWVVTSAAVFNLLGLPVTQVPLGLGRRGLPLGVQVAAGRDNDHVTIAVALELERVFGGWVPPPRG